MVKVYRALCWYRSLYARFRSMSVFARSLADLPQQSFRVMSFWKMTRRFQGMHHELEVSQPLPR